MSEGVDRLTITTSSLWETFFSLSLPSSTCCLSTLTSSRRRRTSASASSRPSTARWRAASVILRSWCLAWRAIELNWLTFSATDLSRPSLGESREGPSRCWLWEMGCKGSGGLMVRRLTLWSSPPPMTGALVGESARPGDASMVSRR